MSANSSTLLGSSHDWWVLTTQVSIRDFEGDLAAATRLPETAGLAQEQLIAVVLPSSKAILCDTSVLTRWSKVLRQELAGSTSGVIHLDFTPATAFDDEMIVDFLSRLHVAGPELSHSFIVKEWVPEWCILITAVDITALVDKGQQALNTAVEAGHDFWRWMRVRLHSLNGDQEVWRNECLHLLASLRIEAIGNVMNEHHKDVILGLLTSDDLFALAGVRLTAASTNDNETAKQTGSTALAAEKRPRFAFNFEQKPVSIGSVVFSFGQSSTAPTAADESTAPASFTLPITASGAFESVPVSTTVVNAQRSRGPRTMVVSRAKDLPEFLQIKLEISPFLTVICDADMMLMRSTFLSQLFVDTDASDTALEMPLVDAISMDDDEVFAFFEVLHSDPQLRRVSKADWKMSWVRLAAYLQISSLETQFAQWIWEVDVNELGDKFWDWVSTSRLHSMQRNRPSTANSTTTREDVLGILRETTLAVRLDYVVHQRAGFLKVLGLDALFELLALP